MTRSPSFLDNVSILQLWLLSFQLVWQTSALTMSGSPWWLRKTIRVMQLKWTWYPRSRWAVCGMIVPRRAAMTWDRPSNKTVSLSGELMTAGMFSLRDHCSQCKATVEEYRLIFIHKILIYCEIILLWKINVCGFCGLPYPQMYVHITNYWIILHFKPVTFVIVSQWTSKILIIHKHWDPWIKMITQY